MTCRARAPGPSAFAGVRSGRVAPASITPSSHGVLTRSHRPRGDLHGHGLQSKAWPWPSETSSHLWMRTAVGGALGKGHKGGTPLLSLNTTPGPRGRGQPPQGHAASQPETWAASSWAGHLPWSMQGCASPPQATPAACPGPTSCILAAAACGRPGARETGHRGLQSCSSPPGSQDPLRPWQRGLRT